MALGFVDVEVDVEVDVDESESITRRLKGLMRVAA